MFMLVELSEGLGVFDLVSLSDGQLAAYMAAASLQTIVLIVSIIFVAMWIHRAHANLREAGYSDLEFTPGWAVGWYFIPLANLIKPFHAMRELWTTSMREHDQFGAEAPSEVKSWWGLWIVGNILSNVGLRLTSYEAADSIAIGSLLGAFSSLLLIGSAWLLIKLIKSITQAQQNGLHVAEVFA